MAKTGVRLIAAVLILCGLSFGQAARFDNFAWTTAGVTFGTAIVASPGASIQVCSYPANAVPCTNLATTYQDISGTTSCPTTSQLTAPDNTTCQGAADSQGNFGFWVQPGSYDYTICTVQGSCSGPYHAFLPVGSSASGPSIINPTITNPTITGGTISPQIIDTVRYADQYSGADLGAKINAAFANCTSCKVIATPGTISTDVIVPITSELDFLPNSSYTLSAHIYLYHRGSTLNAQGARVSCSLDDNTQCIQIGKNNSGTVNINGTTTVTWASGTTFSNIDAGDTININGSAFNIASVTDSTHLVVTATTGSGSGLSYGVYVNPENNFGSSPNGIAVRNLILVHSGGTTTAVDGIGCYFNSNAILENVRIQNFTNSGSYAFFANGCISAELYGYNSNVNGLDFRLDQGTSGGVVYGSNDNKFFGGSTTNTNGSVIINSSLNKIYGHRWEGNTGTFTLTLSTNQFGNVCFGCYFERNGDGTSGSDDYINQAGPDWIYGSYFASGSLNHAASAIVTSGASAETYVENTYITGAYTNGITGPGGGKNHRMGGVHLVGATSGFVAPDVAETGTATLGVTTAPNFVSNIATGTQPYAATSTTVNTNLNADMVDGLHSTDLAPVASGNPVWLSAGTQLPSGHTTIGSCTLSAGACTVTLTGSAAFTSAGTFSCAAVDGTSAAAVKLVKSSGSSLAITGTSTDAILFICAGN